MRKKDWFFRVKSKRLTRLEELRLAVLDGVASEAEEFEYWELYAERTCKAPAQTVEEWKKK
jgi:hypothetical protein